MRLTPKFVLRFGNNFFFKFVITTPRLNPAECYGTNQNTFSIFHGKQLDNLDKNFLSGASRFPFADKFKTAEQASLECDRWRYWLKRDYAVPVDKWSAGSEENFLLNTTANVDAPPCIQYLDFTNQNLATLEKHRDSQDTSERELNWLAKHGDDAQRVTAQLQLGKRANLKAFSERVNMGTIAVKSSSVAHYVKLMTSPLASLMGATTGLEGEKLRAAIEQARSANQAVLAECNSLISEHEKLKLELAKATP